ncbi:hypothetical protein [Rhizobium leguminosarum]|uniref:hypothetical protein n=1 Tax=Rhizobium TaxID=379 RepID=UPI00140FC011|nr:hypothetical protein [Rhizobium leguminosarum]MBY5917735.1 hypothetical protein [Rhizobium leguminosarum]QIO66045.1 hypothetical protein HA462_13725 [Rhizobium leguminosarum bv. trifolii]
MIELSSPELDSLKTIVAGGNYPEFPGVAVFDEFVVNNHLPTAYNVSTDGAFSEFFFRYVMHVNRDGLIDRLVTALCLRCLERSPHKAERLMDLMDPNSIEKAKWICLGNPASAVFSLFDRQALFAGLSELHRFVRSAAEEPSALAAAQIEKSECYFLLLADEDVASFEDDPTSTFALAYRGWSASLEERPKHRKRLIVFTIGQKADDWWNRWKRDHFLKSGVDNTVKPPMLYEGSFKKTPLVSELAPHQKGLREFLECVPPTPPPKDVRILLLGDPFALGGMSGAEGADQRLKYEDLLHDYLNKHFKTSVDRWKDGWVASDRFDTVGRTLFFQENPILVRAGPEGAALEFRDLLLKALAIRLGYPDSAADAQLLESVEKLRKIFWRIAPSPLVETPTGFSHEISIAGGLKDIGAKLAEVAGVLPHSSVVSARYENLRDDHPHRTLLSSKLQEIRRSAAEDGNTVAVSLDLMDETVRRFDDAALNIIAAHDLATRVSDGGADTIRHFAEWETALETAVKKYFPDRQPKILRIAALLNNFNEFEGLRFADESPVWRWNLLKLEPSGAGYTFNAATFNNVQELARNCLSQ